MVSLLALGASGAFGGEAASDEAPRVLLVHSYHAGYGWTADVTEGVRAGLEGTGARLAIVYMDTKRKKAEAEKRAAGEAAKAAMEDFAPDVVIASDDNAQAYFAKDYAGVEGAPPIVFCGVNGNPEDYGYPADNVTGILERTHFAESMALLGKVVPSVRKVAVLLDDSATSAVILPEMQRAEPPPGMEVVATVRAGTLAAWREAIRRLRDEVDAFGVFVHYTITDDAGRTLPGGTLVEELLERGGKPVVGFADLNVEEGALCAVVHSAHEQGFRAARIAAGLLEGRPLATYPVEVERTGTVLLNMATAERLRIVVPYRVIRSADRVIR